MKTVFNNSAEVFHTFAQQNQSNGRCSNAFFDRTKVYSYSYHYLLGEFIDPQTILINDTGYSQTTQKHIGQLRQATRQYKQFFVTETDVKKVLDEVKLNISKLANARKPELYILPSLRLWTKLNEFMQYTKKKQSPEYKEIKKLIKIINSGDVQNDLKALEKKQENAKKRKEREKIKTDLPKFMNGEINYLDGISEDYLRLNGDNVETSQGVKIPIDSARKLYALIKLGRDVKGYELDGYTVIGLNGVLKIGCHQINVKNMHEIGAQL